MPFVITEFEDSQQFQGKVSIEKYLLYGWARGFLGLFHIWGVGWRAVCDGRKEGSEASGVGYVTI